MIIEPNYQPEPSSNQPRDIVEDGLELDPKELSRALLNDLVEAVGDTLIYPNRIKGTSRLEDCYTAYIKHQESLEEM